MSIILWWKKSKFFLKSVLDNWLYSLRRLDDSLEIRWLEFNISFQNISGQGKVRTPDMIAPRNYDLQNICNAYKFDSFTLLLSNACLIRFSDIFRFMTQSCLTRNSPKSNYFQFLLAFQVSPCQLSNKFFILQIRTEGVSSTSVHVMFKYF